MDLSKIYTVLFDEGSAGTFLIWFISQHIDFFRLKNECSNQYEDTVQSTSWTIKGLARHFPISGPPSFEYSKRSLDQYLTRHFTAPIKSNYKIIFKVLPHSYHTAIKVLDHFPKINVVMLVVENYDWINSRLESFERQSSIITESSFEKIKQHQRRFREHFNANHINYCTISINKILNLDTSEYHKLLEFINSSPIDNWQGIVIDYKNKAGIQEVT